MVLNAVIIFKVAADQIKTFIRSLPFTPDVANMMTILEKQSAEIIIISDSNSVFISELLDCAGLKKYIRKVFTNPAYFDEVIKLCR